MTTYETKQRNTQQILSISFILLLLSLIIPSSAWGGWGEEALAIQEFLDTTNTFNMTVWVGAHNAYSADEWGYFDPNQTLKPNNLLDAGARQMEYDPRRDFSNDLRLCHGACTGGEKTMTQGLEQIETFLKQNPNSVIFLKLEMDESLSKTADKLENHLGDYIYRPQEGQIPNDSSCPNRRGLEPEYLTKADILAAGKNVIVFAGNGALDNCPASNSFMNWVHVGLEYESTGWQLQFDKPDSPSESSDYYDQGRMTLVHDPNTFNGINGGGDDQIFTPSNVDNYMNNGHNVFELFNFNGDDTLLYDDVMADDMVWSWERDEPAGNGDCAVVNGWAGPLFNDVGCNYNLPYACYGESTDVWSVTSGSGAWEDGRQTCSAEFGDGFEFAVPTNARQMDDLQGVIDAQNISGGIYVNYHDRNVEGVWQANSIVLDVESTVAVGDASVGTAFDYRYMIDRGLYTADLREVTAARIRAGDRVKGVELTYSDGTVIYHGGSSGSYSSSLSLGDGVSVTNIEVCTFMESGQERVFYLEFTTNIGTSVSNGLRLGSCTDIPLSGDLMGFFGTGGDSHFNSIGFYTTEVVFIPGEEISGRYNSAKCMYKKHDDWKNGTTLEISDCGSAASDNNTWTYESSTGYIRGVMNPDKCLHKRDDNWNNGNPIQVWDCSAGSDADKSWNYDSATGRITARHRATMCMQKQNNNWNNGNPIQLRDCSAGWEANKSWNLD